MNQGWREPHHVVIEVVNKRCRPLEMLTSLGLRSFKVVDIRASRKGSVKHLFELEQGDVGRIPAEYKVAVSRGKVGDRLSLWFESKGCDVCNAILSCDAFLVSGRSLENSTVLYSYLVPSFEAHKNIVTALEKAGLRVNILKLGRFEPRIGVLTEKQERIFWLALRGGFFEFPRKISMSELSDKLKIKPSTLSEIIRRGTRRVLEHHFEKDIRVESARN